MTFDEPMSLCSDIWVYRAQAHILNNGLKNVQKSRSVEVYLNLISAPQITTKENNTIKYAAD